MITKSTVRANNSSEAKLLVPVTLVTEEINDKPYDPDKIQKRWISVLMAAAPPGRVHQSTLLRANQGKPWDAVPRD